MLAVILRPPSAEVLEFEISSYLESVYRIYGRTGSGRRSLTLIKHGDGYALIPPNPLVRAISMEQLAVLARGPG
jgi:hypothetical protein